MTPLLFINPQQNLSSRIYFSAHSMHTIRRSTFNLWILAFGYSLGVIPATAKLLPVPFQSDYLVENWGRDDGFPKSSCTGILLAPDGYLWMATFGGLVRFNGQQFSPWAPEAMPSLITDGIVNVHTDRQHRIWLSTTEGLVMVSGNSWKRWQESDGWNDRGDYVRSYAEDPQGNFIVTRFSGRVMKLEGNQFRELPVLSGTGGSWCVFDEDATLYGAREGNLSLLENGHWRELSGASNLRGRVLGLGQTRQGEALVVCADELLRVRRGVVTARLPLSQPVRQYWTLTEDTTGAIWLPAVDAGVFRIQPDGQVKHFLKPDGLPHSGGTRTVYASADGSIWIGSGVGGLASFRPPRFRHLGEAEGLGDRVILTLAPLRDGRVLLPMYGVGLAYFNGSNTVPVGTSSPIQTPAIRSVLRRADGSIWFGTFGKGLLRLDGSQLTTVTNAIFAANENISALFEDSHNRLWIGSDRQGGYLEDGQYHTVPLKREKFDRGTTFFAEHSDGTLVLARQNQVWAFGPAGLEPKPLVELPKDRVITTTMVDKSDRLWLGTENQGLYGLKKGELVRFSVEQGLPDRFIASLVQDDQGHLWFGSGRQIIRVDPDDLWKGSFASSVQPVLHVFDQNDGLLDVDFPDNTQPSVAKDELGRLWFALVRGAAMVDPANLSLMERPPPVVLESLSYMATGNTKPVTISLPLKSNILLPAGSRGIRISYAALEFLSLRKQRFRVRLNEDEGEWQDMRNEVLANFFELGPGLHTFEVQAAGSDGVWNHEGARLKFFVAHY